MIYKLLSNPLKRFAIGFVSVLCCAIVASFLPPLAVVFFPGMFLILFFGESEKHFWEDGAKTVMCEHCSADTSVKLVRVRHYMTLFIPLPIIYALASRVRIPYGYTYFMVCTKCLEEHVGDDDLATILTIAKGGIATAKEITKEEYDAMCRK